MIFTFDYATFIVAYPAFSDPSKFPEATLQGYWNVATCFMDDNDQCSWLMRGDCRDLALNLMTAHLAQLSVVIAGGQTPGLAQSATVDKITISLTPPPLKNQFDWWLMLTAYGQQLFALLQVSSVGGIFVGGPPPGIPYNPWRTWGCL